MAQTVLVQEVRRLAADVRSFELVDPEGRALPSFTPGSHIIVDMTATLSRPYSLCNDPHDTGHYLIAVQRSADGGGGSHFLHESVRAGDVLKISEPRNNFELVRGRPHYVLIAGGIGITPILSMAWELSRSGGSFELHYTCKSPGRMPFTDALSMADLRDRTTLYLTDRTARMDVGAILRAAPSGSAVYCCGPGTLHAAAREAAIGLPDLTLYEESFAAIELDRSVERAFECVIPSLALSFTVPPDKSILDALIARGVRAPHSCQSGMCGSCEMRLLEGEADHRDQYLLPEERRSKILICVSRAKSRRLVLEFETEASPDASEPASCGSEA